MSKKYRLKKDLPDLDAGATLVFDGNSHYDYVDKKHMDGWYDALTVENNPEWFEEIKEEPSGGGLIGVNIKGNVVNYTNSASIKLGDDDKVTAIAMDGKIFLPEASHQPKEELKEPESGCGICGGKMVFIRGKYPGMNKREVCPTCNTERLEQINEISSKSYGQAYQETKNKLSIP